MLRLILTRVFPWDPLSKETQSPIDIYILTHEKDIEILPYSIIGAVESVKENLKNVYIVAPRKSEQQMKNIISRVYKTAEFICDEEVLDQYLKNDWSKIPPVPKMEILKLCCGLNSPTGTTLIIDGDTLLLRSRIWSSLDKRIAIVAQEYLNRHINFNKSALGIELNLGIGFVSHHGVAEQEFLAKFIHESGGIGNIAKKFTDSYLQFKHPENDFPSEWQMIGELNILSDPKGTKLAKFSNYGMSRKATKFQFSQHADLREITEVLRYFRLQCPKLGSVSFHGYK